MDKASLTLRHITAWQTEHVSLSCLSRIHSPGGLNHVGPHSSPNLSVKRSPLAVFIWPVCILLWCPP